MYANVKDPRRTDRTVIRGEERNARYLGLEQWFNFQIRPLNVRLFCGWFLVQPSAPRVFDAEGREVITTAGPFLEGKELFLSCQVTGG